MQRAILLSIFLLITQSACSQKDPGGNNNQKADKAVGGSCEGCEAVYEYGNRILNATDTLPDFNCPGPKLKVTGTIFRKDGRTPARDVILYIYHTDQTGEYPTRGNDPDGYREGWAKRHGYIRGWIKTGADGKYTFYTLRPGAYPGRQNPEHIHPIIKEPGYQAYWIDEYLFADDPILTKRERESQRGVGGRGVVQPVKDDNGMLVVKRDIILGKNVQGYD